MEYLNRLSLLYLLYSLTPLLISLSLPLSFFLSFFLSYYFRIPSLLNSIAGTFDGWMELR